MNYSYKGKILISTPDISADIFSRAVVSILEHNHKGALGLILNKKDNAKTQQLQLNLATNLEIYRGGPVETNRLFIPMQTSDDEFDYILIDLHIDNFPTNIQQAKLKIFSGYSGWSAGQLEQEIAKKLWTVVDHYPINLHQTTEDDSLWKKIKQSLGGAHLIWANAPENISLN